MAKQVLAASLWYHASLQRPSEQLLKQLSQKLRKSVASAQQASHNSDAVALAQDCSHRSALICPWGCTVPCGAHQLPALVQGGSGVCACADADPSPAGKGDLPIARA